MFFRAFLILCFSASLAEHCTASEHVILLHGLCRTPRSMKTMERTLTAAGYQVWNVSYPSRSASVKQLSDDYVGEAVEHCKAQGATTVHFVTHSMGGILLRSYLKCHKIPQLGKVVMLAPPNGGSEVVSRLGHLPLFQFIHGPAGGELGTSEDSTPNLLGNVDFPLGVIAGNRSLNWINSMIIQGKDDGKVSIKRTRIQGMDDHIVIKTTHPFIMKNGDVCQQTVAFLRDGHFASAPQKTITCRKHRALPYH